MDSNNLFISAYIADNLETEFINYKEFVLHSNTHHNSWLGFVHAIEHASHNDDDVIVICFEGHRFSKEYSTARLIDNITRSAELGTHILLGDCGSFCNLVPVDRELYWVDTFSSSCFYVVFRHAFQMIMSIEAKEDETLENLLSKNVPNKLLAVPFFSSPLNIKGKGVIDRLSIYQHAICRYNLFHNRK